MKIKNRYPAGFVNTFLIDVKGGPYLRVTALDPPFWARYKKADVIDPMTGEVLAGKPVAA